MKIHYRTRFEKEFSKLSKEIKEKLLKQEKILKLNPFSPKLKTHKLHGPLSGFYAFSVDYKYRVIFSFSDNDKEVIELYSIGDHDIYYN